MALSFKGAKRLQWLGILTALFILSVWVVTKKNPATTNQSQPNPNPINPQVPDYQARIDRERKIEGEIEKLDIKIEKIKTLIRAILALSHKRRELRDLQRELYAERRVIRQQLFELRKASEENWEHLADHLEAELEKANELME